MKKMYNIKNMISDGDLDGAAIVLEDNIINHKCIEKDILLLLFSIRETKRRYFLGVISESEYKNFRQQYCSMALQVLNGIEQTIEARLSDIHQDANYAEGQIKFMYGDYTSAMEEFIKVPVNSPYFLKAGLDLCLIKFESAVTEDEINSALDAFDDLEILILRDREFDFNVLVRMLFNRGMILRSLGLPDLAKSDFEKLRIIGSDLCFA
jgi:tetratricopeptide (TPR) repeat protein